MRESIFETVIGAAVVAVAGLFLWFALARGGDAASAPSGSVELGARFSSVSGVERGTDVRMAGVKVGTVRAIELNVERAEALVTMAVSKDLMPLQDGTSARIQTEGLLGGNYINLEPGPGFGEIASCGPDQELFGGSGCGEILYTQGSVDLLTLFASFANGNGEDSDAAGGDSSGSSSASSGETDGYSDPSDDETSDEPTDSPSQEETDSDTESSESSTSFGEPYPGTASSGDDQ
ncbi:MlaD family protein [Henriciella sp.]|uniref:MlaD family protein n=1 Tax=Henriciella sp. TaxID=1968823 RepID=UPI0026230F79|nr:MlaD family protein [Henriciella sp.]